MTMVGILILVVMVVLWVGVFGGAAIASLRERGRQRWFGVAGGLLVILGFLSFLSPTLARWLPSSVEWPIGWAGNVITLPSGMHVVSHDPSNRVQVYDTNWKFLRGWYVDCAGGVFVRTAALPDGTIEIIPARTHMRYVFTVDGQTLLKQPAPPRLPGGSSHASLGEYVPTWPWLWTLTHPFIAFLAILVGIAILGVSGHAKLSKPRTPAATKPPDLTRSLITLSAPCPACATPIPPDDINVAADTALCRACGYTAAYSAIIHAPVTSLYSAPPDRCDVQIVDGRWRAVASTRSWLFFPVCGIALFWNGIVAVFVGIAIRGFPWGLLVLVFLSGHLYVGGMLLCHAACLAMGDVEVVMEDNRVSVSTGVGPLRRRRHRPISEVRGIRQETKRGWRRSSETFLVLDGSKRLRFGGLLNEERRNFLHAVIAGELHRRNPPTL